MSTQIAVRLPDDIMAFLDETVARGETPSRAAVISRALERERAAAQDVRILRQVRPHDDLDDLVEWNASRHEN